mmetsp:Transcript_39054/g.110612  ORF Transcript_39054/g.110612 Transcript_39054/m.110612 type:complete len:199 (-) Transcript_39054:125-721(-)|eukprot:CAMPEP_0117660172 /NCGR_PEP_ID=MMETSP0804-20121206/6825_1 /TAXON_ID=1074897 /ORGANISM="Tetraselmis astigmatica, Strain CCMP880" /LENGTH=198 /DNA_ID=CAMNT_0005466881 /DNA_START=350 /DNA_END=946 /DNA_ORIENTATION=-
MSSHRVRSRSEVVFLTLAAALATVLWVTECRSIQSVSAARPWSVRWPFRSSVQTALEGAFVGDQDLEGSCSPSQVHLALTGDETEMVVSWVTAGSGCKATVTLKRLSQEGHDGDIAPNPLEVESVGYPLQSHIGCDLGDEVLSSGTSKIEIHNAVLKHLTPGGRYKYTIDGASKAGHFTAAPTPAAQVAEQTQPSRPL